MVQRAQSPKQRVRTAGGATRSVRVHSLLGHCTSEMRRKTLGTRQNQRRFEQFVGMRKMQQLGVLDGTQSNKRREEAEIFRGRRRRQQWQPGGKEAGVVFSQLVRVVI